MIPDAGTQVMQFHNCNLYSGHSCDVRISLVRSSLADCHSYFLHSWGSLVALTVNLELNSEIQGCQR